MENGLWPLTNIVRIFLDAQVLKSGVILADLPGYRDINLARVKKAQQYLISCDEVFIVARINRAVTDQSVKESIRAQYRSDAERSKCIVIIFTHADVSSITLKADQTVLNSLTGHRSSKRGEEVSQTCRDGCYEGTQKGKRPSVLRTRLNVSFGRGQVRSNPPFGFEYASHRVLGTSIHLSLLEIETSLLN